LPESTYPKFISICSDQNSVLVNSKGHSANSVQLYIYICILAITGNSLQLILSYPKFIFQVSSRYMCPGMARQLCEWQPKQLEPHPKKHIYSLIKTNMYFL